MLLFLSITTKTGKVHVAAIPIKKTMNDIDLTKRDLLIKIAKMYYLEERSQQEIASAINVSRSSISRMLKACRDLNIVEIRINDTSSVGVNLQNKLVEKLGLDQCLIIPSMQDSELTKIETGRRAAEYLRSKLEIGMNIGVTWGSTLFHMVQYFKPTDITDVEIFQLMGGTATRNFETDGREHARTLARKLNAKCNVLNAPLLVQNQDLREMLIEEPEISQTLQRMKEIDLAILGIGTNDPDESHLAKIGYLSQEESRALYDMGAVGDICGRHLDIHGSTCPFDMHKRVIGIDLAELKQIPLVIVVGAGIAKAEIILGAIRGGYIDVLITDEKAAMQVLALSEQ